MPFSLVSVSPLNKRSILRAKGCTRTYTSTAFDNAVFSTPRLDVNLGLSNHLCIPDGSREYLRELLPEGLSKSGLERNIPTKPTRRRFTYYVCETLPNRYRFDSGRYLPLRGVQAAERPP